MSGGQDPSQWDYEVETSPPVRTLTDIVREYLRAVESHNVLAQFRLRDEMRARIFPPNATDGRKH